MPGELLQGLLRSRAVLLIWRQKPLELLFHAKLECPAEEAVVLLCSHIPNSTFFFSFSLFHLKRNGGRSVGEECLLSLCKAQ